MVDNVRCKTQTDNVVFHIRDLRLLRIEYNVFFCYYGFILLIDIDKLL